MHRRFVSLLSFSLLLVASAAPLPAPAAEAVAVRLSFPAFSAYAPFFVAREKGFYQARGIDATILPGRGSSFAAMTVGSGQEPFAIADAASVVVARAQGMPVVAIATLPQSSGIALFATEASGIQKIEDLRGRNVGIFTGSTTTLFLEALLRKHGMTMQDVKPVSVRSGTDLPLVLSGRIDAEISNYTNELVAWHRLHPELKLRVWPVAEFGYDTPGYAVITNAALLAGKPRLVQDFLAATIEGLAWTIANPDEAVQILVRAEPTLDAATEREKLQAVLPFYTSGLTEARGLGALDRTKWETMNDLLFTYGLIKAKVDLDPLLVAVPRP